MNALGAAEWAPIFSSVPAHFRQFTDPDSPHIKGVFRLDETAFCFVERAPLPQLSARRGSDANARDPVPRVRSSPPPSPGSRAARDARESAQVGSRRRADWFLGREDDIRGFSSVRRRR